ncbi:YdaU family protein [Azospirillum canadense]|uniref:YdaU family protein n=1 Tax=Azospirillum canadense TaxID=403962 RepID=UPI002227B42B|nr:YdaU family protein [Azospirillum canadense]MCW2242207.1 hypothetical protein [Azospirillum canadense]
MMTDSLPAPLVPADVDLKDFPFTPMFRARLFGSSFHARASDAEWRAGVTLWLKSWDQVPAGTLPSDDVELCRLAELGRDMKTWIKIKALALHGWFLCSDGRLHHKVVADGVMEAWNRKIEQRWRSECARIKKGNQRHKTNHPIPTLDEYIATKGYLKRHAPGPSPVPEDDEELSPGTSGDCPEDVPEETASKGQGQGQREKSNNSHFVPVVGAASAANNTEPDDLIAEFDAAIVAMWGKAAKRRKPHATDHATAQEWAEGGITATFAGQVLRERFGKMRDRGARPPFSLSGFSDEMIRATAAQQTEPSAPSAGESVERGQWRNRLTGYRSGIPWSASFGPKPGEANCEAPPDLVAEILPHLAPTAEIVCLTTARRAAL